VSVTDPLGLLLRIVIPDSSLSLIKMTDIVESVSIGSTCIVES